MVELKAATFPQIFQPGRGFLALYATSSQEVVEKVWGKHIRILFEDDIAQLEASTVATFDDRQGVCWLARLLEYVEARQLLELTLSVIVLKVAQRPH